MRFAFLLLFNFGILVKDIFVIYVQKRNTADTRQLPIPIYDFMKWLPRLGSNQGYQIGRKFAQWVMDFFEKYLESTRHFLLLYFIIIF
jgi:hypothetical protein